MTDTGLCKTEFHKLDVRREYKIRVCTIINGKAIARKVKVTEREEGEDDLRSSARSVRSHGSRH